MSRNEPQEQTSMPRRTRTESGYAPGSPEYNVGRDLPTNYGPGPEGVSYAPASEGVANGSWWDNTGRSRDASHGTQVRHMMYICPRLCCWSGFIAQAFDTIGTNLTLSSYFAMLFSYVWRRAISKPLPISNARIPVSAKTSVDIRPSTVTTDLR